VARWREHFAKVGGKRKVGTNTREKKGHLKKQTTSRKKEREKGGKSGPLGDNKLRRSKPQSTPLQRPTRATKKMPIMGRTRTFLPELQDGDGSLALEKRASALNDAKSTPNAEWCRSVGQGRNKSPWGGGGSVPACETKKETSGKNRQRERTKLGDPKKMGGGPGCPIKELTTHQKNPRDSSRGAGGKAGAGSSPLSRQPNVPAHLPTREANTHTDHREKSCPVTESVTRLGGTPLVGKVEVGAPVTRRKLKCHLLGPNPRTAKRWNKEKPETWPRAKQRGTQAGHHPG